MPRLKKYATEKERKTAKAARERERYQKNHYKIREARRAKAEKFKAKKLEYKKGLECMNPDCNFQGAWHPARLEFHHLDPAKKKFSPHKATTWKAFMAEVNKCIPLCNICHAFVESWLKANGRKNNAVKKYTDKVPF